MSGAPRSASGLRGQALRALIRARRPAIGLVLLIVTGCGAPAGGDFSGYVEGDFLYIGPQEAGRVRVLSVAEGDAVKAGAVLAKLEDDIQSADLAAAIASEGEAQARLDRARAATQRPEEVAILEATQRRLTAALDLARIELDRQKALVPKGAASQANLDTAQHTYDQAVASLDEVNRQIDVGHIAARAEDIAAAEQAVKAAQASRAAAQVRLDRRTLTAPADGRVQTLYFRVGELVSEGRPVVSLLPPGLVKVRFFVSEPQLQQIRLGAPVEVTCDGCPPITAEVSFISDAAEYTPPVIYSREERAKLVYLVEAIPRDPALARPGQPVNVRLGTAP